MKSIESPVANFCVRGLVSFKISLNRFFSSSIIFSLVKRIPSFRLLEHEIADCPVMNIHGKIFRLLKCGFTLS